MRVAIQSDAEEGEEEVEGVKTEKESVETVRVLFWDIACSKVVFAD